ncbi:MAG: nucleotidyltransferase domain-containing protein [Acidimicrobiia bacterium]
MASVSRRATTDLVDLVRSRRGEIIALAERRGANNIRVFGSVARDEADVSSDLDLLVDFEPGRSLLDLSGLLLDLEELLGVSVDIIETAALRPQDSHILADAVAL